MTYYCINCWKEIKKGDPVCLYCNSKQIELNNKSFVNKLINALNHPEPETPIRVANILAQLNVKEAIPFLLTKLKNEKDPFIIEAIVDALIKIDLTGTKLEIIKILSINPPVTVKNLLKELKK